MSAPMTPFSPEVEAILREVAAGPRSSLLRVERPQVAKGLFERAAAVGPGAAGLTALERHLLQVHRSEVALLLHEYCKLRLATGSRSKPFINRNLTADRDVEVMEEPELRARARETERALADDAVDVGAADLLARCVGDGIRSPGRMPAVASIATAALRLEPNDATRLCAGLDFVFQDKPQVTLQVCRDVLRGSPGPLLASIAWDHAGLAMETMRDLARASRYYRESALTDDARSFPLMAWIFVAIQLGDAGGLASASVRLNDLVTADHPVIESFVADCRARRSVRYWSPTAESHVLLQRVGGRMIDAARRVADVFA